LSSSSSWTRHLLPIAASVMGVLAVGGVVATLSPNERASSAPVLAQAQSPSPPQSSAPLVVRARPEHMSVVSMAEDAVRREFLATRQTGGVIRSGSENGRSAERWRLQALPPGFMLVSRAPGHMVFSDGKVSMSVFVDHPARPSPTSAGGVSVFERIVHGQRFTVLGDAPAQAVQQLAEAIEVDE
jgi:hypothetical protein